MCAGVPVHHLLDLVDQLLQPEVGAVTAHLHEVHQTREPRLASELPYLGPNLILAWEEAVCRQGRTLTPTLTTCMWGLTQFTA